jgi:UPF0755 protein
VSGDRRDNDLRGSARRSADARGARKAGRAFRPLRWAWLLLLVALLAPSFDLFFPAGLQPPDERRTVVIERGQSLHEISRELQRTGVIKSQVGFLVLARAMSLDRSVKAGQYSFRLGITVPALLRALDRGMYGLNLVTIPEGLMIRETARLIQMQVGISAIAIDSLSRDAALLDSLEIGAPSLEGWLAPDSYEWLPGTAPEVVLRTMVARTRERVQRATAGYDSLPLGMNQHEVLTLASIVESESRANDERPRIARAYLNRLERGMLLQADPTVGYALGRGPRSRLLFKDLRVESPYNTYRHEGLPPGPICSPGESAIQAVMNATPGTNDLYFVANGKGRHIFAPTYQQHLENISMVKSRMKAESMAAARTAAALKAVDDELVVGGAIGDSGAVRPPGATAPDATNAATPGAPAAPAPSGAGRVKAPPVVSLSRLPAVPSSESATAATKPVAGSATASKSVASTSTTSKPVASSTTPAKPTAAKSAPATPTASGGNTALKGDLLVPRRSATVASSTPGSVEVVRKPVPKPAATDVSPAKPAAGKSTTTTKSGTKSTTTEPASTKSTPATKSTTTDPAPAKSTASKPATKSTTTDASTTKSTATTKPAAKPATTDASTSKSTTTKPAVKPAAKDTAPAKSASAKSTTKPAAKPAAADTSHKKPAAKKPAPKPAPKDTTR